MKAFSSIGSSSFGSTSLSWLWSPCPEIHHTSVMYNDHQIRRLISRSMAEPPEGGEFRRIISAMVRAIPDTMISYLLIPYPTDMAAGGGLPTKEQCFRCPITMANTQRCNQYASLDIFKRDIQEICLQQPLRFGCQVRSLATDVRVS